MKCEDCGGQITGTNAEIVAQNNGLLLCEDCIESMEEEADAYDEMMRAAGVECVFVPGRGFVQRQIANDDRSWELTQDLTKLPF